MIGDKRTIVSCQLGAASAMNGTRAIPQGLKPKFSCALAARLKPCPTQNICRPALTGNWQLTTDFLYEFKSSTRSDCLCGGDADHTGADGASRQRVSGRRRRGGRDRSQVAGASRAGKNWLANMARPITASRFGRSRVGIACRPSRSSMRWCAASPRV